MKLEKNTDNPILSVTELNQYARGILEMHVGKITVMGEISNFSKPSSGHWYFTLKDTNAQIRCAMFQNKNRFLRLQPTNGMQIIVQGNVSIYEGRGEYQLIADYMEESGIGALQKQFEQLKVKLAAEGLFDNKSKQPLPKHPIHIGVITSPTGAAIHDILSVLNDRFPSMQIMLIPTAVQGSNAAGEICHAIELAERWNSENIDTIDIIILGRGGGSIEDLWAFNEEIVARAIFSCKIPIISAVGHETDVTIADYVADVRAPTPSAAAEIISPDQYALKQTLDRYEQLLARSIKNRLESKIQILKILQKSLKHPGEQLSYFLLRFKQLSSELISTEQKYLNKEKHNISLLSQHLFMRNPSSSIHDQTKQSTYLLTHLIKSINTRIKQFNVTLHQQAKLLNTVSPLSTLERGYAIVRDENHHIIRSAGNHKAGDTITATLADGELVCSIKNINL